LSTGFNHLDGILNGGLLPGSITELAGPSNTGKTTVSLIRAMLMQLLSNIILSRLGSTPDVEAVYIDTLGTYNPALLQSLLPRHSTDDTILNRIHLMTAFDMIGLIEACETIKQSLSRFVPIEILVIDTIANPLSLLMNKGQLQGAFHVAILTQVMR
jgi:RecA/RadA recombinase